ncbi:DUF433 domain-containing protein [Hymenobacter sp. BT507]|uniref:DUF433 domain-containing protein n=1 Tax=Hymenobacter citatus TaxID=2763506 RepID=A0ABR7MMW2_9BACT|nr:DUF433 domain-containing protein [Hymenobacter citatus]MBC6612288.1 DUF433 domain-containing protein [Hymenobacter citatus]
MQYIHDRITIDPDLCNGKPTIRGMRLTVQTVLEFLAAGDSSEDILEEYPFLELADVQACLHFALETVAHQNFSDRAA